MRRDRQAVLLVKLRVNHQISNGKQGSLPAEKHLLPLNVAIQDTATG